jgi:DUF4097 and DUF4098 domain-containing protein YvlB
VKKYSAAAQEIQSIKVHAENKTIEFVSSKSDQVVIEYCPAQGQRYQFSNENGIFAVENQDRSRKERFPTFWFDGSDLSPEDLITVHVPKNYAGDMMVEAENSEVSVKDFQQLKTFRCETSNAAVSLSGLSAQTVKLQSHNAVISLQDVTAAGALSAQTDNAAISLKRIMYPDIVLKTENAMVSGVILGRKEDYSIEATTSNAVSNLQSRSGGKKKLSVDTSNGMISIQFKAN